jgi:hypothetical protein
LREEKRKKNKARKAAKASGRQTGRQEERAERWTTISLRLPTAGRDLRLCEKKKEKKN